MKIRRLNEDLDTEPWTMEKFEDLLHFSKNPKIYKQTKKYNL